MLCFSVRKITRKRRIQSNEKCAQAVADFMVKAWAEDEFWDWILDSVLGQGAVTFGAPWIRQWSQLHQFQQQCLKRLLDFSAAPEVRGTLYLTIMGFVLDPVQLDQKEKRSWVGRPGWIRPRPRTERLLRVVSAGAGLTIATSMTNSPSTGTSSSLWKQNKLNNKGERWHSPPFSQLHQINCPSQIWAPDRCWSPMPAARWRSDKSFSIPGFPADVITVGIWW